VSSKVLEGALEFRETALTDIEELFSVRSRTRENAFSTERLAELVGAWVKWKALTRSPPGAKRTVSLQLRAHHVFHFRADVCTVMGHSDHRGPLKHCLGLDRHIHWALPDD
jgi:hypothetical protein